MSIPKSITAISELVSSVGISDKSIVYLAQCIVKKASKPQTFRSLRDIPNHRDAKKWEMIKDVLYAADIGDESKVVCLQSLFNKEDDEEDDEEDDKELEV